MDVGSVSVYQNLLLWFPRLITMKMSGHLYSTGVRGRGGSRCLSSSAEQKKLLLPSPGVANGPALALARCSSHSLRGGGRAPMGWTDLVTMSLGAVHGCQGDGHSCDSLSLPPHLGLGFFSS